VVITGVVRKHGCVTSFEIKRARVAVSGEDGGARGARMEVEPFFALLREVNDHPQLNALYVEDLRSDANATPSRPSAR
jgi:hypothetical protein